MRSHVADPGRFVIALWVILALCPVYRCCGQSTDRAGPPNILFLFADDLRADALGATGNPHIRSPHIDLLAQQGISFQQAYCMGSIHGAVCIPSRAMLMGGKTLFRTRMDLAGQVTFPELLGRAGYATFVTGKWHNGQAALLRSFEQGRSVMLGGMSDHSQVPVHDIDSAGTLVGPRTADGFSSTEFADAAVDFLNSQRTDQPFLCYVAFTAPHDPRMPPASFAEMYRDSLPPLPANFLPRHPFDTGQLTVRDEVLAGWPRTADVIQQQLAEYYGMITQMDEQIGRIMAALKQRGDAGNTVVIFAADHGLALGSHGLLGKQSLYEHSMRAPLILVGPGIGAGQTSEELVYLHDLFATICDYAGVAIPDAVEGRSLRPVMEGSARGVRDSLFTAYAQYGRAVRQGDWKLIRWPQVNKTQLFNLAEDPDEMHDLSDRPGMGPQVNRLLELMVNWQADLDDRQPLWVAGSSAGSVDLQGFRRKPDRWQPAWIVEKYFTSEAGK